MSWLILDMTGSPFLLGMVTAFRLIPNGIFAAIAGSVADTVDRRKPILIAQAGSTLLFLVTALLVTTGWIQVWHILLITFLRGIANAFDQPTRQTLIYDLAGKENLLNANAMNRIAMRGSLIIGSPLAGVIVSTWGIAYCLYITAAVSLLGTITVTMIPPIARSLSPGREPLLRGLLRAAGYVRRQNLLLVLLAMEIAFDVFAIPYNVLMPVFARDVLKVGATGLGFLMAAAGAGEVMGALILAPLSSYGRKGWLLLASYIGMGGLIVVFALSPWYAISMLILVGVGMLHTANMVLLPTLLQSHAAEEMRGRVMGIYVLTWSSVPLGSLQSGAIASLLGAPFAVGLGGIIVALFTVAVAITQPSLRRVK